MHGTTAGAWGARCSQSDRRRFLATTIGIVRDQIRGTDSASCADWHQRKAVPLTKEQRDRMTPGQVLDDIVRQGNERFRTGKMVSRDYRERQQRASAAGQFPAAVVLGCIDGRVRRPRLSSTRASATRSTRGSRGTSSTTICSGAWSLPAPWHGAKVLPALRTHRVWRDRGGDRRCGDGQLDGAAGPHQAGYFGHDV